MKNVSIIIFIHVCAITFMGCSSRQLIPPIDVSITPCVDCGKDIKPSEINDKLYIRLRSEYERKSKEHACGENDSRYAKNSSLASLILHIGSSIIQPKSIPVFDYQVKDATCVAEPTLEQSLTPWTILNTKEPIYLSWKFARQNKDSIDLNKIRGDVSEVAKFIGSAGVKEAVAVPLSQNSCRLKFLKKIKFEIRDENVYKVF